MSTREGNLKLANSGVYVMGGLVALATSLWMTLIRGQLVNWSREYRLFFRKLGFPYYTDRADEITAILAGIVGMAMGVAFVAVGLFGPGQG